MKDHTTLIVSDLHSVYMDEDWFACVCAIIKENPFSAILINGDLIDCTSLSRHPKPVHQADHEEFSVNESLLYEVRHVKKNILAPLRKAAGPKVAITYRQEANHEWRYLYPKRSSPANDEILKVEGKLGVRRGNLDELLELGRYDIQLDKKMDSTLYGDTLITHGDRATKTAPLANFKDSDRNFISSHTHRLGVYRQTMRGSGKRKFAGETGHGRTQGYHIEYSKKPLDWQQGFAVLTHSPRGITDFHQYEVNNGFCCYNGIWYAA